MAFSSSVLQTALQGNPQPSYQLAWQDTGTTIPTFAARNFGVAKAAVVDFTVDWRANSVGGNAYAGFGVLRELGGAGPSILIALGAGVWSVSVGSAGDWIGHSAVASSGALAGLAADTWFRVRILATVNADSSVTVTATVRTTADVDIGTVTATMNIVTGDYCGFFGIGIPQLGGTNIMWADNIVVKASGSTGVVIVNVATSYVYTFINSNVGGAGVVWESAPSPASATILRPDGVSVDVTTATAHAFDVLYGIDKKRIYRAVTGATGTAFLLVAEIPLATAVYTDTKDDSEVGPDVLESEDWDIPNAAMEGIIHLPNGMMAGFFRNQLCLSALGHPHAWPVKFRLTTDTDIVAIANIDNTIVIGTKSFVYTATGNDPATYAMSKPGEPQACVSKRSMVYLDGFGVIFASPDGYQVCSGSAGNVRNATEMIFTKRQWQALVPSSILAAVHDGVVHFWFTGTTPDAGYAFDTKQSGFGIITLAYHAQAAHVNPITDALYLVLDVVSEPTDGALPIASSAVTASTSTIYEFDAHTTAKMVYRYRGKLNLVPYPTVFHLSKVEAGDFSNLIARVIVDGTQIHQKVITTNTEFRIPEKLSGTSVELELIGTSTVRSHQVAQDVIELD